MCYKVFATSGHESTTHHFDVGLRMKVGLNGRWVSRKVGLEKDEMRRRTISGFERRRVSTDDGFRRRWIWSKRMGFYEGGFGARGTATRTVRRERSTKAGLEQEEERRRELQKEKVAMNPSRFL